MLRSDARVGLAENKRRLCARWCFDGYGRRLYSRLAAQPGDHLLAVERRLLAEAAPRVGAAARSRTFVHIGPRVPGWADPLVDALAGTLSAVVVCDTPHGAPDPELTDLTDGRRQIDAYGVLAALPESPPALPGPKRRLVSLPLATFAVLEPPQRRRLLTCLRKRMSPGVDHLLVAAPLPGALSRQKPLFVSETAAEFNRNVLNVVNHTLDAGADTSAFDHVVHVDSSGDRLELRLRASFRMTLELWSLGFRIDVAAGSQLHTFALTAVDADVLDRELRESGFSTTRRRRDDEQTLSLTLAAAD